MECAVFFCESVRGASQDVFVLGLVGRPNQPQHERKREALHGWTTMLLTLNLKPSNVFLAASYRWIFWIRLLQHADLEPLTGNAPLDLTTNWRYRTASWRSKHHCQADEAKGARRRTSRSYHLLKWLPTSSISVGAQRVPQFAIRGEATDMQVPGDRRTTDGTKRARIPCLLLEAVERRLPPRRIRATAGVPQLSSRLGENVQVLSSLGVRSSLSNTHLGEVVWAVCGERLHIREREPGERVEQEGA